MTWTLWKYLGLAALACEFIAASTMTVLLARDRFPAALIALCFVVAFFICIPILACIDLHALAPTDQTKT
jgi:hypothetical protein